MNIFHVLSQGKSRLHEPSMSAMLGYLLDSSKDHGLGDAFIRVFVRHLDETRFEDVLSLPFIESHVSLEEPYELEGRRKDIDIEICILNSQGSEAHRIIIENKIRPDAANTNQFCDYYRAVVSDDNEIKSLWMVFLTPGSNSPGLVNEFDNLQNADVSIGHSKKWVYWDSPAGVSVVAMLLNILAMEAAGEINPINEYMRHTLKAFVRHSRSIVSCVGQKTMRTGEDIGEVVDEKVITLNNGSRYNVVRRDSKQIQVFNLESGEKEVARQIMGQYIDEQRIGIPYPSLNTRAIGRHLLNWLVEQERGE